MSGADFLAPVSALPAFAPDEVAPAVRPSAEGGAAAAGFSDRVANGLEQVNEQLLGTQVDLQALATGASANLHRTMIRLEEARLAFQLTMQVRNRLLESYQELMRTQV